MIFGPETPWAGDASIKSWASASLKTVFITAKDMADVCGGKPLIVFWISNLLIDLSER
jgi:hypothetical protein